jgi:hypothetical protein
MKREREEVFEDFAREFIRRHRAAPPPWSIERIRVATDFSLCSLNVAEHVVRSAPCPVLTVGPRKGG